MKVKRRLNESLVEESFVISVPIIVKFRITSSDEEIIIKQSHDEILYQLREEVEYRLDKKIFPYLEEMQSELEDSIDSTMSIGRIYANLSGYKTVTIINGNLFFEVSISSPADKSTIYRVFNTVLNNNAIGTEFTITMEDDYFDIYDVIVNIEKYDNVELEEY